MNCDLLLLLACVVSRRFDDRLRLTQAVRRRQGRRLGSVKLHFD